MMQSDAPTAAGKLLDALDAPPTEPTSLLPLEQARDTLGDLFPQARERVAEQRRLAAENPAGKLLDLYERTRPLNAADAFDAIRPERLVPYLASVSEADELYKLVENASAMQEGSATPEQEAAVTAYFDRMTRDKTFGYKVVDILGALPANVGEFAVGLGVGKAATFAGKKALGVVAREAAEEAIKQQAKVGIRKAITKVATFAAEVGVQTAFNEAASIGLAAAMDMDAPGGRISADAYQRQLDAAGVQLSRDEAGQLAVTFERTMPEFIGVLPQAIASQLIENISERAGEGIAAGLKKIPIPAKVAALQADVLKWWRGKNPDAPISEFFKMVAEKGGWQGPIPEWAEERLGAALRAATPGMQERWSDVFPEWQQQAAELAAFSVPGVAQQAITSFAGAIDQAPASETEIPVVPRQEGESVQDLLARTQGEAAPGSGPDLADPNADPGQSAPGEVVAAGADIADPGRISGASPEGATEAPTTTEQAGAEVPAETPSAPEATEATEAPADPTQASRSAERKSLGLPDPSAADFAVSGDQLGDQYEETLFAYYRDASGEPVELGRLDYTLWRGEMHIKMVEVPEEFRRMGYATALYDEAQRRNPGFKLQESMRTPDGGEFRNAYDERRRTASQEPPKVPRAIRVPPEEQGQLPASMRVSRPQDPLAPTDEGGEVPIGDELRGRLEDPPEPLPGEPVNKPQVISAMAKTVEAAGGKVPIKTGKVSKAGKGTLGFYHPHTDVIRVKTANDLTTAAHEMGHALDRHIFGKVGAVAKQVGPAENAELAKIGRDLYGSTRPAAGYRSEGFAEWMNWWVTDPARAAKEAPKFTAWFDSQFLPSNEKVAAELNKVRDFTTRWRGQGAAERVRQSIVDPATPTARVKRATANATERAIGAVIEEGWPLRKLSKTAEAQGARLRPSRDPYKLFTALRMTHAAVVDRMVADGMRDFAGNKVGPSLAEIRPLIKGRYAEFRDYLVARRALSLLTDEQGPRNPGITQEDAETVIAKYDSPEFERAAAKLYEWNDGVLSYAAQSGPFFEKLVTAIRKRDPGNYIPLYREIDEAAKGWLGSGRKGGSPVKRLRGSGRRIKDPIQGLLAGANEWVKASHKRAVLDAILGVAKLPGMGHIIEKVPQDQVPVATRSLEDMIETVKAEAAKAGGSVEVTAEGVDLASEMLTIFAHSQMPKGSENVVPIVNAEGKVEWYEVQKDLFESLTGLDVYRLPGMLEILSIPARLARMGHTGMRASFALVKNPIRDAFTLYENSRADGSGAELFAGWARNMLSGLSYAIGNEGGMTEAHKLFLRLGGEMAMPLGQDMAHTRRAARRLSQGRLEHIMDPRNAFDTLRDVLQFPEMAPRVAEMAQVAKDRGLDLSQPISEDDSIELINAFKQVTTDFTAAGSFSRTWNRITPFHNAAIQSPRAALRAFTRNPIRYVARSIVSLTVPTLLLYWMNKDEEWWKELPAREKFSYWHIPVDMPGHEGERIKIPRPYETGSLFAAMPEAFLDSWYNEDPDAASEWFDHFAQVTTPPVAPLVISEVYEQARNRDTFFDSPIVPMREERKPPEEQFDEYTTRAARKLGDIFGVSPRRIDHAMRSTLGGVSMDLLALSNMLPDPLKLGPEGNPSDFELADTPVVGRLFARGGEYGTRSKSVDRLFEALDEAQTLQASDRHEETREARQLRLQLADAAKAVTNLFAVRRLTEDKEQRRALTVEIAAIAREALKLQSEEKVRRERVRLTRDRAERQKERAERIAARRTSESEASN